MRKPWYSYLYVRSPIAKIGWSIAAVVVSLLVIAVVGFFEEQRMEAQEAAWHGRSVEIGASLFANNCTSCHGFDGKGLPGVAPALHSRYFFTQRLADLGFTGSLANYVSLTVHAGRPSKTQTQWAQVMATWGSGFGGPLRADQVQHLVNYVLNWEEDALAQTAEEDPWQFFQDALSKQLPYAEDEPGFQAKVDAALAAAQAAGATNYTIGGQSPAPVEETAAGGGAARPPDELFTSMGCAGCHILTEPQTEDNRGAVGPNMANLDETAGARVEGMDAVAYIHDSIVNPNAFINPGYLANIMPQNFSERMSEEEIQGMIQWLLEQAAAN